MLYRHALESVFAFLGQGELAFSLRVSRDWLAAAHSMASLQLTVKKPAAPVRVVAASAMGRHVAVLGRVHVRLSLNADALFVVARLMPHLRRLFCQLDPQPAGEPLSFPASLRELEIGQRGPVSAAELSTTLAAVGRLSRLESFTIILPEVLDPLISFAPLAALPQLRILRIHSEDGPLSDAQADELRTMPRLHELFVPKMNPETLRRLLRQPHDLQWQEISLPISPLDDETAALLPQLPSLTQIEIMTTCSRFDWLRGLPNLAHVGLMFERVGAGGRVPSLVSALGHCSNIEFLSLHGCADLTAAELADLLPSLPRLRELTLSRLSIDSLAFLVHRPTALELTQLSVEYCEKLRLPELRHVHALRHLQSLTLDQSFREPMDSYSQSLFTPPSVILPQLRSFDYTPWQLDPNEVEDDEDENEGGDDEDEEEGDE